MSANTTPIFTLVPYTPGVVITGTTTDKSGATTTNIKTLYTATTNGIKVTRVNFKFSGTSTAGTALIWITDTDGITIFLAYELVYSAITSSTTVATAEANFIFNDLQLKSGQKLLVGATTVNTNIHVTASIGDF